MQKSSAVKQWEFANMSKGKTYNVASWCLKKHIFWTVKKKKKIKSWTADVYLVRVYSLMTFSWKPDAPQPFQTMRQKVQDLNLTRGEKIRRNTDMSGSVIEAQSWNDDAQYGRPAPITECDWSAMCGISNSGTPDALPTPHFTSSASSLMHPQWSPATLFRLDVSHSKKTQKGAMII